MFLLFNIKSNCKKTKLNYIEKLYHILHFEMNNNKKVIFEVLNEVDEN